MQWKRVDHVYLEQVARETSRQFRHQNYLRISIREVTNRNVDGTSQDLA